MVYTGKNKRFYDCKVGLMYMYSMLPSVHLFQWRRLPLLDLVAIFFLVCGFGTYGKQCSGQCGKCQDPAKCHHADGTCLTGCIAGYRGDLCKTCE